MSFIFRGRGKSNLIKDIHDFKICNDKMNNSEIYARERGCTKVAASKTCALSMVRQLYDLKIIGPAVPPTVGSKKNPQGDTKPFPIILRLENERLLDRTLLEHQISPLHVVIHCLVCFFFGTDIVLFQPSCKVRRALQKLYRGRNAGYGDLLWFQHQYSHQTILEYRAPT